VAEEGPSADGLLFIVFLRLCQISHARLRCVGVHV
jgi:hypothetical protein